MARGATTEGNVKPRNLRGQVVLISGAAGGLGAALCRRYAAAGSHVAAMDLDADRLSSLVAALTQGGNQALALPGNVADPGACAAAVATTLAHFGRLDGLINNAGISQRSLLQDTRIEVIRKVMEVNFFGALHLTHAALPAIKAQRGFIAAISSVAGFAPLIGRTGYAASKHALHGFFDSLRCEVEDDGVNVTLVCPSFIRTGIGGAALGGTGAAANSQRVTTGVEASPEDIAERIFSAVADGRRLLLPDRTSRLAWWLGRLAPAFYARTMKRRVGAEFDKLPR